MRTDLPALHAVASWRQILRPGECEPAATLLRTPGAVWTLNARGALFRAFSHLQGRSGRDEVLVPAFHCPSVVVPLLAAGLRPVFYGITRDLQVDWDDLRGRCGPRTRAVLVIHYFGHATDLGPLQAVRDTGVAVVEDWSHSFLRADATGFTGDAANHRVYSLWKLLPTQVGGAWLAPVGTPPQDGPARVPLRRQAVLAKRLLEETLDHHGPAVLARGVHRLDHWRATRKPSAQAPARPADPMQLQRAGEALYPFAPDTDSARMPWWTRRMVAGSDLAEVARKRLRHHQHYAQALLSHPRVRPWRTAAPEAVPWVFPVFVEDRDRHDRGWRARGVPLHTFGIYLHSALFRSGSTRVIDDALYLADRLLCLAVHQDLDDADLAHACEVLWSNA